MKNFLKDKGKLTGVLVVSLSVNLFFAGFLTARYLRQSPRGDAAPEIAIQRLGEFLPPARRAELRDKLREGRARIARNVARVQDARDRAAALLESDTYDAQELERILNEIRDLNAQTQQTVHQMVISITGKLDPDVRRRMIERWYFRHPRRDKGPHRGPQR